MGFIEQIIPGLLFKGRIDSVGLLLVIIMSVLTDSSPVCEICKIRNKPIFSEFCKLKLYDWKIDYLDNIKYFLD